MSVVTRNYEKFCNQLFLVTNSIGIGVFLYRIYEVLWKCYKIIVFLMNQTGWGATGVV